MGNLSTSFKVMVVEDDESIRDGMRELLEMEGYSVETAAHGAQALERIHRGGEPPRLILLDLNMPVMSGGEFLERIRAEGGQPAEIPVVVMTAVPDAKITGVAGLLRKPVELDEILDKVRSFERTS